jgi:hypothetical protein
MRAETRAYQLRHGGGFCRFRLLLQDGQAYIGRRRESSHLVEVEPNVRLAGVGADDGPASLFQSSTGEAILVPHSLRPLLERHLSYLKSTTKQGDLTHDHD